MPKNPGNLHYQFGEFRFDAEKPGLWRGGRVVALPPRGTDVLAY